MGNESDCRKGSGIVLVIFAGLLALAAFWRATRGQLSTVGTSGE